MVDQLCSLDSRSYVDTLSNLAFVDGIEAWSAIEGIEKGALPGEILPVMFHEITHHWTSSSLVGSALSAAKMSATWAMLGGKYAPKSMSAGDYAKYLAAGTFLRAWSEGLAQFAEFNVTAGASRSLTFATNLMWQLYCFGKEERADVLRAGNVRLGAARTTRAMIERKANALRQPFTVRSGGYLPGYLAVKRVAGRLRAAGGPFEDSDFVLSYLKSFVFDDPVAVKMFLDRDGMVFVDDYFEHVGRRFADLLSRDDGELRRAGGELDEFLERHKVDDGEGRCFPGLLVERTEFPGAFQALLKRLDELGVLEEAALHDEGPKNVLLRFYQGIARQRHLFCLASSDLPPSEVRHARLTTGEAVVLVRTPERNTILLSHWNRERYADLKTIESPKIDPKTPQLVDLPDLRLEVWINPVKVGMFVCLHSCHGKRVGITSLMGPCKWDDLPEDVCPRNDAIQLIEQIDGLLMAARVAGRAGAPPATLGEATAGLRERVITTTDQMLAWLAFPSPLYEQLGPMLAAKGLGALPSYRPDALRGLSAMTLADAAGQSAKDVCGRAGLPPGYLELASGLLHDMESLGWPAHSGCVWMV